MIDINSSNNEQSEKLSQYTLLPGNQQNTLRKQSLMSEPPTGLGIENYNINTEDISFNRRMKKNSFNSSISNHQHSKETLYPPNSEFPYSGSENTKRRSISQSPRSNISFDNKRRMQDPSKKLDEISNRVVALENTVNQLIYLIARNQDVNLEEENAGTEILTTKNVAYNNNTHVSEEQDEDDNDESDEENHDMSPITTTVKNPITQEPKLFKLDPKKIVKKRNKSKSNSVVSSFTKLNKLPYIEQDLNSSNTIINNNNKLSISNMLDPNPNNFNMTNGTSFFSSIPLLETNGKKRNSSLGLPLPLNANGNLIFPGMGQQQTIMNLQPPKKSHSHLQPLLMPSAGSHPQSIDDKDSHKPSIMMPSMNGSLALPGFSPRGTLNGSIDSLSSVRTSFDDKQLQMYQQLQRISQQQQQMTNQQAQAGTGTQVKMDFLLNNPGFHLDSVVEQGASLVSPKKINSGSNSNSNSMSNDYARSKNESDESPHVLAEPPDVSQLLNNTGRLKTQTVSKANPKVKPKYQYSINRAPSNIDQVWREYRYGIDQKPPLMELDQKFGNYWLESKSRKTYSRRKVIYEYILRGVNEGLPEKLLINQLEDLRYYPTKSGKAGKKGVGWVQDKLINFHTALGYVKMDNLIRGGALNHIIHDDEQVKVLLSNDSFNNEG